MWGCIVTIKIISLNDSIVTIITKPCIVTLFSENQNACIVTILSIPQSFPQNPALYDTEHSSPVTVCYRCITTFLVLT